jgi:DNA-binding MarR family transcriptional regulator
MSQIADRLERSGLVGRISEIDDRRVRSLQLTPRGMEIMNSRKERRARRVSDAIETLTAESRSSIVSSLQTLLRGALASAPEAAEDVMAEGIG